MADINPSYIEISDDDDDEIQQEQHPELPINDHPEHEDADDDLLVDPDYEQYLAGLLASSFSQNAAGIDGGTDSGDEDGFGVPPSAAEIADETDFGDETEEADFLNVVASAGETEQSGGAEEGGEKRRRIGGPETSAAAGGIGSKKGLICSICLDARTVEGDHRICSLPCGHLFGMSCINRWLQHKDTGKCPICNRKCELKDVLKLFVSYPWDDSVDDDELEKQKMIRELKDKCASLENELAALRKNEAKLQLKDEQRTKVTSFPFFIMGSIYRLFGNLISYSALRLVFPIN